MPRSDPDTRPVDPDACRHARTVWRVAGPVRGGFPRHLAGGIPGRQHGAGVELTALSATET